MANSRNSTPLSKLATRVDAAFRRALEAIPARVVVSGVAGRSPEPRRIAVAYSGGLDSSVLLHLAAHYCRDAGIDLYAFHVHHGLSPNAGQWLAHCRGQADALGVHFDAREVLVQHIADYGTEQAARLARYNALAEMCTQHQVALLLTAHHQDDQAETVLLQLFRGSGLRGLGGMAALHDDHALLGEGIAMLRPLLDSSRTELEQYAREHAIAHIDDESNTDTRYRRNAIRQQIAPAIEAHFPGFAATVSRSARHLQSAQRLLDELARIDLATCEQGGALVIDQLRKLSADRIDNVLRYWLQGQGADAVPSEAQLTQLRRQMLDAHLDAQPELLLSGLCLQRRLGKLVAMAGSGAMAPPSSAIEILWQGEEVIEVPGWQGSLRFDMDVAGGLDPALLQRGPLQLRPRSGSERLKPSLQRPSRTLKNLFQESCIPARARPWLPLLYIDGELAFAAGLGMDARFLRGGTGIRLHWLSALHHVK